MGAPRGDARRGELLAYSAFEARVASSGLSLSLVSVAAAAGASFLALLPDTHGRELEAISSRSRGA